MKRIFILLLITILTSSCSVLINRQLKQNHVFDTKSELFDWLSNDKSLVFIGMHHIGKKEFYDDVSLKIDSLQKLGYVAFYEGVTFNNIDSLSKDLYVRKHRKLSGSIGSEYLDTINQKLVGKYRVSKKHRLINQPSYRKMNVDATVAINADLNLDILIDSFEKKYFKVVLDDCDLETALDNKNYTCKKVTSKLRGKYSYEFLLNLRDKHLAKKIHNSDHGKILVIYGRRHVNGLLHELRELDSSWKILR